MCSTIAAATMSRSVSVKGLLLSADLEPERKPHVVAQFLSNGWCPGHGAQENVTGTEVNSETSLRPSCLCSSAICMVTNGESGNPEVSVHDSDESA
jgi:hypothetical protein